MTLRQLQILWAVAHAPTLTQASKLLGLAQPSLSQQLSRLEESLGVKLFDRSNNQLHITDAGRFLLRKAEAILAEVDEAVAGMGDFARGVRGLVAVGTLNSVARSLLPEAMALMAVRFPEVELDIHEVAPADALDMLSGRRINLAVLSAQAAAASSIPFHQEEVMADPYVLAVPRGIDLSQVEDPDNDLPQAGRAVLNRCIRFEFGTAHARRIEHWYHEFLPRHRVVCHSRTYEVALSLVQEGLGVALVPALAARLDAGRMFDVTLYRVDLPVRRLVVLVPPQYRRVELYAAFIDILRDVGGRMRLPPVAPTPPFLRRGWADTGRSLLWQA